MRNLEVIWFGLGSKTSRLDLIKSSMLALKMTASHDICHMTGYNISKRQWFYTGHELHSPVENPVLC